MNLLDLRAESYVAQGKLDLAAADAAAMIELAGAEKSPALKAQALKCKALVQMRHGELTDAVKSASAAVGLKHASSTQRAESLFRFGEAQFRSGQTDAGLKTAREALKLFEDAGDLSGAGRIHWLISMATHRLSRPEESRAAAQTALTLCQQAGDQYGIGNAYNLLNFTDPDIPEQIKHSQQALQAYQAGGYFERETVALGNLAISYGDLGLYPHVRRLRLELLERHRGTGAKAALANILASQIEIELRLGNLDAARGPLPEYAKLVSMLDDPIQDMSLAGARGDLARREGDLDAAIRHYKSAVRIARKAAPGRENITLTQLGQAHLAKGEFAAALKCTARATDLHRDQSYGLPDGFTSQEIWWRHAQALTVNGKTSAARESLERAYGFLLDSIANLRDEGLCRNYLNKVEVNREIIAAWLADGVKRKLPKERLFAHLAIESNVREPFQRLADAGLRLNALHDVAEIQTFLVEEATELCGGERVLLILDSAGERVVAEAIVPVGEDTGKLVRSLDAHLARAGIARTALLQYTPKSGPVQKQRSRVVAPLIAQNKLLGYVYADMDGVYGRFTDADRDMLGMLANQAAVALDNAQWAQGLERKVEARTAELNQRVGELEIINAIQRGLAAELNFQAIVDLVGDKLREIFASDVTGIGVYDRAKDRVLTPYLVDHGERYFPEPRVPGGISGKVLQTRLPIIIHTEEELNRVSVETGSDSNLGGTEIDRSFVYAPLVSGELAMGLIVIGKQEEHAFSDSDVSLITTVAASLSVALQNAQSFEAERQRNAELAVINSIQQGMAGSLDFQGIVDLVGDKLREVMQTQDIGISWYDPQTRFATPLYAYEHGKRLDQEPHPLDPAARASECSRLASRWS